MTKYNFSGTLFSKVLLHLSTGQANLCAIPP